MSEQRYYTETWERGFWVRNASSDILADCPDRATAVWLAGELNDNARLKAALVEIASLEPTSSVYGREQDIARAALAGEEDKQDKHTVDFEEHGWGLQHPMECRPDLLRCRVNRAMRFISNPPAQGLGRYSVRLNETDELEFEKEGETG